MSQENGSPFLITLEHPLGLDDVIEYLETEKIKTTRVLRVLGVIEATLTPAQEAAVRDLAEVRAVEPAGEVHI